MRSGALTALLLLVFVLAAACGPRRDPPPAPPVSSRDAELERIETRETQLDDDFVTVRLHIPPTPEPRKPTVIAMGDRSALLGRGFLVVTYRINWDVHNQSPPAAPPPAEAPVGEWVLASPSPDVLGREYLRAVATTANEVIPKIVDWLVTVPEVDPARIGIIGASTNGLVTLQAVARDHRIAAAVALAACGDYHAFLRDSSMGMDGQPLALDPAYERWIRTQEIVRHPQRAVHTALLMVNRNRDPVIPFSCVEPTAKALERAYRRAHVSGRFRFTVFDSDRHGLDARDATAAWAWFDRWLGSPPPHGKAG